MFKTRLLSGIVLVIIALITVITGQDLLFGVLLVISLIGMSELYKVVDVHKKLLGFTGYLAGIAYYVCLRFGTDCTVNYRIFNFVDGGLCIFFSKIYSTTGYVCIFWFVLCCADAFLRVSDTYASAGRFPCMAYFPVFMGK